MRGATGWIVAITLLAHLTGLRGGFVYDDRRFVVENSALEQASLTELALDPAAQTSDADRDIYRPLRTLGHAFDRRRWGLEPFGFHLHSLLVHLANALLALWVLRLLLPDSGPAPPLLGATALACHPIGVEAVGWITSRGDLYAVTGALLALGAYALDAPARSRSVRVTLATLGATAAFLAVMGKESAAVIPLVAGLHRLLTGRGSRLGLGALIAGVLLAITAHQIALGGGVPQQTAAHGGDRLTQAGWALYGTGRTLGALLLPQGLAVEYPQHTWLDGGSPWLRLPSLFTLGVIGAAWVLRRGRPAMAFCIGWMLLAYLPSSSLLVTLRALVNDRAAYPLLPAFGAILGLWIARGGRLLLWITTVSLTLIWATLAARQHHAFHDERALWTNVLEHHPASVKAHLGLAWVASHEEPDRERDHLQRAISAAISGTRVQGLALAQLGDLTLRRDRDAAGAVPILQRALTILRSTREKVAPAPEETATAASLAWALWLDGRDASARAVLERAMRDEPDDTLLLVVQAVQSLLRARQVGDDAALDQARAAIERASEAAPGHPAVQAVMTWIEEAESGG